MPDETTETTSLRVWKDALGYGGRICASAETEEELVALREQWYAERNPAGYGEAVIHGISGRFTMSQNLSCD